MAKKKARKKSLKTAKLQAWNAFSRYIRLRDTGSNGLIPCCTCGREYSFSSIDAGHWITRGWLPTLFEETNVHGQCVGCNLGKGGRADDYERFIARVYGVEEVDRLRALKHANIKYTLNDYEEIRTKYIALYDELKEERGE